MSAAIHAFRATVQAALGPAAEFAEVIGPSAATATALVTPTSEMAPDAANVGGLVHTETQRLIFEQPTDDGKRFVMLRAHLVPKGYRPRCTAASDGPVCLYVARRGLGRELCDVAAVCAFAQQVGASND